MKQKIEITYKTMGHGRAFLQPIAVSAADNEIYVLAKYFNKDAFSLCSVDWVRLEITLDLPEGKDNLPIRYIVIANDKDYEMLAHYNPEFAQDIIQTGDPHDDLVKNFYTMHKVYGVNFIYNEYLPNQQTVAQEQKEQHHWSSYTFLGVYTVGLFAAIAAKAAPSVIEATKSMLFKQ